MTGSASAVRRGTVPSRGCLARCVLTLVLALGKAGCSEVPRQPHSAGGPRDSVGLAATRIPYGDAAGSSEIAPRLVYSTAPDVELGHVAGAVFLPDSSLLVADRMYSELISLDGSGSVLERAGRHGDGPGEYEYLTRLGIGEDDTPFVYDRCQRRFTFLDSRGRPDAGSGKSARNTRPSELSKWTERAESGSEALPGPQIRIECGRCSRRPDPWSAG